MIDLARGMKCLPILFSWFLISLGFSPSLFFFFFFLSKKPMDFINKIQLHPIVKLNQYEMAFLLMWLNFYMHAWCVHIYKYVCEMHAWYVTWILTLFAILIANSIIIAKIYMFNYEFVVFINFFLVDELVYTLV